jgi:hypothetical protein
MKTHMAYNNLKTVVVMLVLGLIIGHGAQAQDIDYNLGCPNPAFNLPAIPGGTAIPAPIVIDIDNPPAGSPTMSIFSIDNPPVCSPCSSPQSFLGLTFTVSGSQVQITGNPDIILNGTTIQFTLQASSGGSNCNRAYNMLVQRKPLDLVIVLDRSGSMKNGYSGNSNPPAGSRRWDGLSTGVGIMASQLGMLSLLPDDQIGLRYFTGNAVTPPAPFSGNLVAMSSNTGALASEVSPSIIPSGSTALGAGMVAGRNVLQSGPAPHNRAMIVFSDGEQNAGDKVKTVNPNAFVQTVGGQDLNGNSDEIKIHTIFLSSTGQGSSVMQGIANANGGQFLNSSAGNAAQFTTFFSTHLVNILSGSSPQHVDIRHGNFPAGNQEPVITESFSVNKSAINVIVTLVSPVNNEPNITSLKKDGVEMIQFARREFGNGFVTLGVQFPSPTGAPIGNSAGGEWTVTAMHHSRGKAVAYDLTIMVDDHIVKPTYSVDNLNPRVGQPITPSVSLTKIGTPVTNAQVQAIIIKPGDDINDLIARSDVSFTIPDVDPGSPADAKFTELMKDSAFVNKIKPSNQVLNLTFDNTAKQYTGTFNGADIVGVYQIVYRISADDPDQGKIRRYHQRSIDVHFKDIDFNASFIGKAINASGQTVLTFKPVSTTGKLIGSGWGGVIGLTATNAQINNIVDKGDGSYEIIVDGNLSGPGKLTVLDETAYEGDLGKLGKGSSIIDKIQEWLISLGLPGWSIWVLLLLLLILLWLLFRKKK